MHFELLGNQRRWRLRRAWLAACVFALFSALVGAQPAVSNTERALPGLLHVDIASQTAPRVSLAAGLGYGYLDAEQVEHTGQRLQSGLAAAFRVVPWLNLGLQFQGHLDRYADAANGSESNAYGEPRLSVRYAARPWGAWVWGLQADARLVGSAAPSIEWAATSPALRVLVARPVAYRTWVGGQLGFVVDRSAEAVPNPSALSVNDRRTLGASSFNALSWGLGAAHRLGNTSTELLAEVSGQWLLGADSPPLSQSPARLSLGGRQRLSEAFSALLKSDVAFSARASETRSAPLFPAEPRVSVSVAVMWQWDEPKPPAPAPKSTPKVTPKPAAPPPAKLPPPPPPETSTVRGRVVDEGGRPLADAEVELEMQAQLPQSARTDAEGRYEFPKVLEGALQLRISTPGFETVNVPIAAGAAREQEVVLRPAVPAGQVRGRVLDLQGRPVTANISISPGQHVLAAGLDGSFELELAPGQYTVKFEHADFAPQQRKIKVHDRGVVILDVALVR